MGLSLMAELLRVQEVELFEPLELGVGLKLLTADDNNERYRIHRLLRQIQRDTLPVSERGDWAETICERMVGWFKDRKEEFNDLADFEAEQDQLESWAELAKENIWSQCSGLIWLQAYPAWHWGEFQDSDSLMQVKRRKIQGFSRLFDDFGAHGAPYLKTSHKTSLPTKPFLITIKPLQRYSTRSSLCQR
jgi:hypothetical protein